MITTESLGPYRSPRALHRAWGLAGATYRENDMSKTTTSEPAGHCVSHPAERVTIVQHDEHIFHVKDAAGRVCLTINAWAEWGDKQTKRVTLNVAPVGFDSLVASEPTDGRQVHVSRGQRAASLGGGPRSLALRVENMPFALDVDEIAVDF